MVLDEIRSCMLTGKQEILTSLGKGCRGGGGVAE